MKSRAAGDSTSSTTPPPAGEQPGRHDKHNTTREVALEAISVAEQAGADVSELKARLG